jgi:hypothetical protein
MPFSWTLRQCWVSGAAGSGAVADDVLGAAVEAPVVEVAEVPWLAGGDQLLAAPASDGAGGHTRCESSTQPVVVAVVAALLLGAALLVGFTSVLGAAAGVGQLRAAGYGTDAACARHPDYSAVITATVAGRLFQTIRVQSRWRRS